MAAALPMSLKDARAALGVDALATAGEVRRAFREAAKQAHPDRAGGDAERFRRIVEAYRRLSAPPPTSLFQPPARRPAAPDVLVIDPVAACCGGAVSHTTAGGRNLRISLPAGLRNGDIVRAGGVDLSVAVRSGEGLLVRGDDVWLSLAVEPRTLAEGGRVVVATPHGRRMLWLSRKAGERGLVRVEGQGLPPRGRHARGNLFIRLTAAQPQADSSSRDRLRRFAAAWAA